MFLTSVISLTVGTTQRHRIEATMILSAFTGKISQITLGSTVLTSADPLQILTSNTGTSTTLVRSSTVSVKTTTCQLMVSTQLIYTLECGRRHSLGTPKTWTCKFFNICHRNFLYLPSLLDTPSTICTSAPLKPGTQSRLATVESSRNLLPPSFPTPPKFAALFCGTR